MATGNNEGDVGSISAVVGGTDGTGETARYDKKSQDQLHILILLAKKNNISRVSWSLVYFSAQYDYKKFLKFN